MQHEDDVIECDVSEPKTNHSAFSPSKYSTVTIHNMFLHFWKVHYPVVIIIMILKAFPSSNTSKQLGKIKLFNLKLLLC